MAVLCGECQRDVPALWIGSRKHFRRLLDSSESRCGRNVVDWRTTSDEGFCGSEISECQRSQQSRLPVRARSFVCRSVVQERFRKFVLQAGVCRMTAGDQQAHCRALLPVHVGQGIDLGTGIEQGLRDVYRVVGRLLPPVLDTIGGDVVQECCFVPTYLAGADQLGQLL